MQTSFSGRMFSVTNGRCDEEKVHYSFLKSQRMFYSNETSKTVHNREGLQNNYLGHILVVDISII